MSEPPLSSPMPRRPAARRRPWRNWIGILVVLLVAVALALLLSFCARRSGDGAPGGGPPGSGGPPGGGPGGRRHGGAGGRGGPPAITVGIAKATLGDIPITVEGLGTVTPLATVNVVSRISGMMQQVTFREGQMVRKGQLLAQIDPRPYKIAVDQAHAQLLHDQALLADANLDLARYRTLQASDSIARQTVDTQAALVKQDEATVASDQANLDNARLNLTYTRITAPVSGRVGLRQIDAGNQITAFSSSPIAVVTQIDPITVVFSLPEEKIGQVARASAHGGRLPVTALDRDGGTVLARGVLATLDNLIDTTTGTVKAKAQFANPGGALFPSQFVNVTMLVDTLKNQVVVPATATRHGPSGDFVWVLRDDRTVKQTPVTLGPGTAEMVSVTQGLGAGQTVITEGGDRLRDGAPVVLPGQRPGGGGRHHGGGAAEGAAEGPSADAAAAPPPGAAEAPGAQGPQSEGPASHGAGAGQHPHHWRGGQPGQAAGGGAPS